MAVTSPDGRGEKRPSTLGHDEGVAGEDHRDMMVPASEPSPLEVVEAQFTLHLFVRLFGAVALFPPANDLLLGHLCRQVGDRELGGLALSIRPFDEQPHGLVVLHGEAVVVGKSNAAQREPRRQLPVRALAPGDPSERALAELPSEGGGGGTTTSPPSCARTPSSWPNVPGLFPPRAGGRVKPVRSCARPERHFVDSLATIRLGVAPELRLIAARFERGLRRSRRHCAT